jgi:hypothetical protein
MTKTSAELLRETMDAINGIVSAETPAVPVQVAAPAMKRSYMFTTVVPNPTPGDEEEINVGVDYSMEGKYYPATFEDPAEYPEIVDIKVFDVETGQEISSLLPESVLDTIDSECWNHYSKGPRAITDVEPDDYMIDESIIPDHKFQTVVSIYNPEIDDDEDCQVGIDYAISGKYYPATFEDPEEHPDLEIGGVYDLETGEDVSSKMSESNWEMIRNECMANAQNQDDDAKVDRYLSNRDANYDY